jgi:hypothetical protein
MLFWALMFVVLAFVVAVVGLGLDSPPRRHRAHPPYVSRSRAFRAASTRSGVSSGGPSTASVSATTARPGAPGASQLHRLALVLAAGAEARARRARCSAVRARLSVGAGRARSRPLPS